MSEIGFPKRTNFANDKAGIGKRILARSIDWAIHTVTGLGMLLSLIAIMNMIGFNPFFGTMIADTQPPLIVFSYPIPSYLYFIYDNDLTFLYFFIYIFISGILVMLFYELFLIALRGQTLGKMVTNIVVVKIKDGSYPGWKISCARWAVLYLPLLFPLIGILLYLLVIASSFFDSQRRGWHDKIAGTIVVSTSERPRCRRSSGGGL